MFWLDSDDRINSNALKSFKDNVLDNPHVDCWLLPYIYSKNPDGSPQTSLTRERFVRKSKKPTWIGAIHETIAVHYMRHADYENLKVEHNRDGKFIDPKRNLRILEKEFEKNPNEPRTAYYFAKELFDHIDPRAKDKLIHYVNLNCDKYWDDEIGARFRLAKQYLHEGNFRAAIQSIEFVYHLDSTRRRSEYYFIYGEVESRLRNYEIAIDWYKRCLYDPPGSPRVLCLEYWTWHPHKKLAECYTELGKLDEALYHIQKVKEVLPNDVGINLWASRLQNNKIHPKPNCSLTTLEFGTDFRVDSYKVNQDVIKCGKESVVFDRAWKFTKVAPFEDNCLDGIVFDPAKFPDFCVTELCRLIKAGGFLWVVASDKHLLDSTTRLFYSKLSLFFNDLGVVNYHGVKIHNMVRIDESKPSIGYRYFADSMKYGGYRYRINNFIMSAKKNGYPVFDLNKEIREVDLYIDMQMELRHGKINVLEFCEKLDNYSCNVGNADVLNACSPLLAEYLKSKFPDKIVINVDDHFEVMNTAWL